MNSNKTNIVNNINKAIRLSKPKIIIKERKARLECDIFECNQSRTIWYEVDKNYSKFLCNELSDSFLISIIYYAMTSGQDIYCDAPVTEALLHNINEIIIPVLVANDNKLERIRVISSVYMHSIEGEEVGTGISLGVDSMYTISQYINSQYYISKLSYLLNVNMVGIIGTYEDGYTSDTLNEHHQNVLKAAKELKLPIIFMDSNIKMISTE